MSASLPRPDWAMDGSLAIQYEGAIQDLSLAYGRNRGRARATLADWDAEAVRRGLSRRSPHYFRDMWEWLPSGSTHTSERDQLAADHAESLERALTAARRARG